ncbi:unnamed protein product [Ixodes hexagonus]
MDGPLLSRNAEELEISRKICDVSTSRTRNMKPESVFYNLFSALGHVKKPYKIELRDDAVALALMAPRKVQFPPRPVST